MAIKIDSPEVDELVDELMGYTDESISQILIRALRDRLADEKTKHLNRRSVKDDILRIGRECAALPIVDARGPDDVIGYDQNGIPA